MVTITIEGGGTGFTNVLVDGILITEEDNYDMALEIVYIIEDVLDAVGVGYVTEDLT